MKGVLQFVHRPELVTTVLAVCQLPNSQVLSLRFFQMKGGQELDDINLGGLRLSPDGVLRTVIYRMERSARSGHRPGSSIA